jgi:hypothetical protein
MADFPSNPWDNDAQVSNWRSTADLYEDAIEIVGEAIQNAVRKLKSSTKKGKKLSIKIDFTSNRFIVTDNGGGFVSVTKIGLDSTEHKDSKGSNDKDGGSGFGVGMNAIIANSEHCSIKSDFKNEKISGEIIYNKFYSITTSKLSEDQKKEKITKNFKTIKSKSKIGFTEISFSLRNDYFQELKEIMEEYSDPVNWIVAELKLRTPLGYTSGLFDEEVPNIDLEVEIIDASGKPHSPKIDFGFSAYDNIKDSKFKVHDTIAKKDKGNIAKDQILFYRKKPMKAPGLSLKVVAWGINGTDDDDSADKRWERNFNENLSLRASSDRFFVSINGFLQSFNPQLGNTSSVARIVNWATVVVDANINIVDKGRNTLKKGVLKPIQTAILDALKTMNNAIKKGGPKKTYIVNKAKILNTVKEVNSGKKLTKTKNVGMIPAESIFVGVPKEEQEVVGLFVEFVSKKFIKGIKIIQLTGTGTYDFLFKLDLRLKEVGTLFSGPIIKNIKGVSEETVYSKVEGFHYTVGEIKLNGEDLLSDCKRNSSPKVDYQIELGICWDFKELDENSDYQIRVCPDSKKLHPLVTHVIENKDSPDTNFIPMIKLSDHIWFS